ncbi:MAG: DUF4860 domain-containing protein [Bacillota bacterium]|nr:DUF4860 domain-containing protein [Bacillota bacterium]
MRRRGYTLIEMVLVMFLLILVSFYVFTLTGVGSSAWLRLTDWQNSTSDLRIGISYIDVKVRSHDVAGRIDIRPDPFSGNDALVISRPVGEETFLTWIYIHDGSLYELFVRENAAVTPEMGNKIADIQTMQLSMPSPRQLSVTLVNGSGEMARSRTRTIGLNSGGVGP